MDWSTKRYFVQREFLCKHCKIERMDDAFVTMLDNLRDALGFPLFVTSGYRCENHPVERAKKSPGVHSFGLAADLAVYGEHAYRLVGAAYKFEFRGIFIYRGHVHLDQHLGDPERPRPTIGAGES